MSEIKAPMPGTIIEILVKEGDHVQEDQELILLEAMKMENPIYATCGGTVKEIKVKVDDTVKEDNVLIIIE
ncbi:MAG: acetyl-CoA carboxylase biotin carboxyl carrier protein subunit [Bacillota bacterium]|nr:acetyl-CoA carboxylase biotin carboxyl carrier protein subunit [Bacillota bacterium]